jgi:ABC-type nickel/cobalt efflux system permease component RcnA
MLYTRGRNFIKYGSAVREHAHPHILDEHKHDEAHTHTHPHNHTNTDTASKVKLRDLVILGISGGLVPCADAFVVLLIAIYMGRVALGMIIILAFSVGLAGILIAIGVMMVKAKPLVEKLGMGGNFIKGYLPIASALLVSVIGVYITYQSVAKLI